MHCAASCNNLPMVKFLVERGACVFATTISDHETPSDKCEEDEDGFDGCSQFLIAIQEKIGVLNNGRVYAAYDYDAKYEDELDFKVGDEMIVLNKSDKEKGWWWTKHSSSGSEGFVPRNYLAVGRKSFDFFSFLKIFIFLFLFFFYLALSSFIVSTCFGDGLRN